MNLKKILKFLSFLLIFLLSIFYTYIITIADGDELWCFGFSYNLANNLIPYKDFNMIVTPLFPILSSIFLKVFANQLIGIHFFNALNITLISYLVYQKIGLKFLPLVPVFIILPSSIGYNNLSYQLMILLLLIIDNPKIKHQDLIIPFIISLIFLTKQTIGLTLLLPCLIYSKTKLKSLVSFSVPLLLFLIYLVYHESLFAFIDYCFLGMLDFTIQNSNSSFLIIPELVIIFLSIIHLLLTRFRDKQIFYVLMFQIVVFPIVEPAHFFIGLIPYIYIIIERIDCPLKYTLIITAIAFCFSTTIEYLREYNQENSKIELYPYPSLIYKRNMGYGISEIIKDMTDLVELANNNYDNVYNFTSLSYITKLLADVPINKYDLINYGNMGYNGEAKILEEIKKTCAKETCFFLINQQELYERDDRMQTSYKILNYVDTNYELKRSIYIYNIYTSPK